MKHSLYPKLAFDGMKKNKTLYLPYLLTCGGMVMMHYILSFLKYSDVVETMFGFSVLRTILMLGAHIVAFFSFLFLFYTHSFLIRKRKKEYGLYHLLGMDKLHITFIVFWEHLFSALVTLTGGLAFGIAFSKFAELGLINVIHSQVTYSLHISFSSVSETLTMFGIIHILLFLHSAWQLHRTDTISLMKSEKEGEKPPRANWPFGLAGLLLLGCGYYLALTVEDPIDAITIFFLAVLLVICGTYLLMIFGSVLLCRTLQKNKAYYYKANHFVSVSSMAYRMKRNGSRLATICILSTMVLVMISSTVCLYSGIERDILERRYPRDMNLSVSSQDWNSLSAEMQDTVRDEVLSIVDEHNANPTSYADYVISSYAGFLRGNEILEEPVSDGTAIQTQLVDIDDYNRILGTDETLSDNEVIVYSNRMDLTLDTIILHGKEYNVKKIIPDFIGNSYAAMVIFPTIMVFVPELPETLVQFSTGNAVTLYHDWFYSFNVSLGAEDEIRLLYALQSYFMDEANRSTQGLKVTIESRTESRQSFYDLYGGLFYLGILLSIVFVIATVLILYYMQISEGYEDSARFDIMQKIGMTKTEIRKSINSQLLTVFALPMLLSACHLIFAFPAISRLLSLFDLHNISSFMITTFISFLCYSVVYVIFYRMTSNAYYKIVSGTQQKSN